MSGAFGSHFGFPNGVRNVDDLRLLGTLLRSVSDEGGIIHRNYEMRDDIIEEKKREGNLFVLSLAIQVFQLQVSGQDATLENVSLLTQLMFLFRGGSFVYPRKIYMWWDKEWNNGGP